MSHKLKSSPPPLLTKYYNTLEFVCMRLWKSCLIIWYLNFFIPRTLLRYAFEIFTKIEFQTATLSFLIFCMWLWNRSSSIFITLSLRQFFYEKVKVMSPLSLCGIINSCMMVCNSNLVIFEFLFFIPKWTEENTFLKIADGRNEEGMQLYVHEYEY